MTISLAETSYRYEGNGITPTFSYPNRVFTTADLVVKLLTRSTSAVVETLTLTTHYSVTITSNNQGSVTITDSSKIPSSTQDILIYIDLDSVQTSEFPVGGDAFPAQRVEPALDKIVAYNQQQDKLIKNSLKLKDEDPLRDSGFSGLYFDVPEEVEDRADRALMWNSSGDEVTHGPTALDIANAADNAAIATAAAAAAETTLSEIRTPFGKTNIKVLQSSMDGHYGFNSAILETDTPGKLVVIYRYGSDHGLSLGAGVYAADTYDMGQTLENHRIIYRNDSYDTRNFVAAKMNGRIGVIAARIGSGAVYTDPIFIYNDSDGEGSWSTVTITAPSVGYGISFHGGIYQWPTSAGGDDDDGFVAYAYGSGSNDIDLVKTTNNGASWTIVQSVVQDTASFSLSEMAVARVGTEDKWIMVMRTGQDNAAVALSTNLTTWSGPYDSGMYFDSNPPQLIYFEDNMWFIGFSRKDREIVDGMSSHIVYCKANASQLYSAGGDFSSLGAEWTSLSPVPNWASGYLFPSFINDKWWATFVCGEQDTGGASGPKSSMLCLIGDFINIAQNPYDSIRSFPKKNSVINSQFCSWTRGATFTLTDTSVVETADGWFAAGGAGDTTVVSRENFTPGQKLVKANPKHYLKFASSIISGATTHGIGTILGDVSLYNGMRCTLSFYGAMPSGGKTDIGRIRIVQYFGTGGSASANVNYSVASSYDIGTTFCYHEIQFEMPSISGKTLGSNNDDYVSLYFYPVFAENSSYNLQITNVKVEPYPFASPLEPETSKEVRSRLGRSPIPSVGAAVISGGSLAINVDFNPGVMVVDTEASSATDDLDTITGGYEGQVLTFFGASSSRDVTFKDGTGNLSIAGDFTLTNAADRITLQRYSTIWFELSRSDNA